VRSDCHNGIEIVWYSYRFFLNILYIGLPWFSVAIYTKQTELLFCGIHPVVVQSTNIDTCVAVNHNKMFSAPLLYSTCFSKHAAYNGRANKRVLFFGWQQYMCQYRWNLGHQYTYFCGLQKDILVSLTTFWFPAWSGILDFWISQDLSFLKNYAMTTGKQRHLKGRNAFSVSFKWPGIILPCK